MMHEDNTLEMDRVVCSSVVDTYPHMDLQLPRFMHGSHGNRDMVFYGFHFDTGTLTEKVMGTLSRQDESPTSL